MSLAGLTALDNFTGIYVSDNNEFLVVLLS